MLPLKGHDQQMQMRTLSLRTVIGETPTQPVRMLDNEKVISASKSNIYIIQIYPFSFCVILSQHTSSEKGKYNLI